MTPAPRALDMSHLPDYNISNQNPLWWGQFLMTFIEGSLLCILYASYYYIRLSYDIWPPAGVQFPGVALPTISLVLLIASCAGSYIASEAAKKDNRGRVLFGLFLNVVLALGAMAFRIWEWSLLNFDWRVGAYGSIVWTILGVHTLDVFADLLFTAVLIVIFVFGKHGPKQRLGVHVDSVVWYFLVIIWIPAYITLYWGPYFAGAPK